MEHDYDIGYGIGAFFILCERINDHISFILLFLLLFVCYLLWLLLTVLFRFFFMLKIKIFIQPSIQSFKQTLHLIHVNRIYYKCMIYFQYPSIYLSSNQRHPHTLTVPFHSS